MSPGVDLFGMSFMYSRCGQSGNGTYGRDWGRQTMKVFDKDEESIKNIVKSIPVEENGSPFNIGDYGTADGSASMIFLKDLMVCLREHHGPHLQFQVIYEDLPNNDFNSLFRRLSGAIPDPPSYLQDLDNVFPLASGIEFRKQCVPSNSMHFIMSSIAVHWLSKVPTKYKDSLYSYPVSSIDEKRKLFDQAKEDWELFLRMRSRELKQGGILYVICPANCFDKNDEASFNDGRMVFHLFTDLWKFFKNTNRITESEFFNTNFCFCFYTMQQLLQPFQDSETNGSYSGLQVLSAETIKIPNIDYSIWKQKFEDDKTNDIETYARDTTASMRVWSYQTFLSGLSHDRSVEEKKEIIDELFTLYEQRLKEMTPENFVVEYSFHRLIIRKL